MRKGWDICGSSNHDQTPKPPPVTSRKDVSIEGKALAVSRLLQQVFSRGGGGYTRS